MNINFEHPYALLLIVLFIIIEFIAPIKNSSIYFPHANVVKRFSSKSSNYLFILKWVAIVTFLLALASPYKSNKIVKQNHKGYDISMVVDVSGSMQERNFSITSTDSKFDIVKRIVSKFIIKRKNDNVGLIVFADYPVLISPPTYDKQWLVKLFSVVKIGVAGVQTAIYDAMLQAIKLIKDSNAKKKIIILLTDGQNTTGTVPENIVIEALKDYKNIKVYTIGIGDDSNYNRDELEKISKVSGGKFYSANDSQALGNIYKQIDRLERSKIRSKNIVLKNYYYEYPLILSFISLLLFLLLKIRRSF